jgi:hypothetical protein
LAHEEDPQQTCEVILQWLADNPAN